MNTRQIAELTLPHLVRAARERRLITYGELAAAVGVHHRPLPGALGHIRDTICVPNNLPLINAIVVNGETRLPGHSFLPEGTSHLTPQQYKARFEQLRDQVFEYHGWEGFLESLGLQPVAPTPAQLEQEALGYVEYERRRGGTGESDLHARLKESVAKQPDLLGLPGGLVGKTEFLFPSGDKCDVVFEEGPDRSTVVEIKDGTNRGDLIKGVYQAVKYRALLEAVKGLGVPHQVRAFLAAPHVPEEIESYARKLTVGTVTIALDLEQ